MGVYVRDGSPSKLAFAVTDAKTVIVQVKPLSYHRESIPEVVLRRGRQIQKVCDVLMGNNQ